MVRGVVLRACVSVDDKTSDDGRESSRRARDVSRFYVARLVTIGLVHGGIPFIRMHAKLA